MGRGRLALRKTRKRQVEVPTPMPRRAYFADDAGAAGAEEDGEAEAEDRQPRTEEGPKKRRGKDRASPVAGKRRTPLPFDDP